MTVAEVENTVIERVRKWLGNEVGVRSRDLVGELGLELTKKEQTGLWLGTFLSIKYARPVEDACLEVRFWQIFVV